MASVGNQGGITKGKREGEVVRELKLGNKQLSGCLAVLNVLFLNLKEDILD